MSTGGRPVQVTVAFETSRGAVALSASILKRTAGGVVLRFEPRRTYSGAAGTVTALLARVDGTSHALLMRPVDVPGRLLPDGGREVTFAFLARSDATTAFLGALGG
ncbi:MAG: hypothetical protein ACKO91_07115 [Acidimicrobiales bacterium]